MSQPSASRHLEEELDGPVETLALVFGDQLDPCVALLEELDRERDAVLLLELEEEATHVASHRQRTALFLAAMRHFALDLLEAGFRVRYVRLDEEGNRQNFTDELERQLEALKPERLRLTWPGEWRVLEAARSWEERFGLPVEILPDRHFNLTSEDFERWAEGRKELVMEYLYREERRNLDILVDEKGKPEGGTWNFDKENRKSLRGAPERPPRLESSPDEVTREVLDLVAERFPDAPGELESFAWPVTREEALGWLERFVAERLDFFGPYQDAMAVGEEWLWHSTLSTSLNLRLLRVEECVEAAVAAYEAGDAPLNSVEGFVRQIIGWREFIRGVYWREGPDYPERNALGHEGQLPEFYWTGDTDMTCLRESIGQVLRHGYGHHIQRLMITGNFALTAQVNPQEVNAWYLGMYVDAIDWVTAPNTVGMALHADGGVVGTKPYASSGSYISRMSDYCKSCPFDPKKRVGEDACPFTTFYWDFLLRHEERFRPNRRMGHSIRNLDRFDDEERAAIRERADELREEFGI